MDINNPLAVEPKRENDIANQEFSDKFFSNSL